MDYRVEQLSSAAGVSVDTLRFYQARGLLCPPRRSGRLAIYNDEHLAQLRRIRSLQQQGFTLSQIQRVGDQPDVEGETHEPLLEALRHENIGRRTLSQDELAAESGVPVALIGAAQSAGLIAPVVVAGDARFNEADVGLMRAGRILLEAGLPLQELFGLASQHARNIDDVCEAAIDLFDDHIRKSEHRDPSNSDDSDAADDAGRQDADSVTRIFEKLLPEVTRLVALHFQRTLVTRALSRLQDKNEHSALAEALAETESATLKVEVSWR